MEFQWTERRGIVTREDLAAFERMRGIRLPPEYVEMVLHHDGASIDDITDFDVVDPQRGDDVRGFGTLLSHDRSLDTDSMYGPFVDRAPVGIVPITIDGMGEYVALDYREGRADPAVVIWPGPHDPGDGSGIILLAENFSVFLSLLRHPQD